MVMVIVFPSTTSTCLSSFLLLSLFLVYFQLPLLSANKTCFQPFQCGNLTNITLPFYNISNSECGLYSIPIKCDEFIPKIWSKEFGELGVVKGISYTEKTLLVHVPDWPSHGCDIIYGFNSPIFKFLTFPKRRPSPNLTFFICESGKYFAHENLPKELYKYPGCQSRDIFYTHQEENLAPESRLHDCDVVQLPMLLPPSFDYDNLSSISDVSFTFQWDITPECLDCHEKGSRCIRNGEMENSNCSLYAASPSPSNKDGTQSKQKLKMGIGIGVCAGIVVCLAVVALIYILCRKKFLVHWSSGKLLSGTISSDSSSKSELGRCNTLLPTQVFTYEELQEATHNFDSSKELGDGGFGTVYHGIIRDGRSVAVKRLYKNNYRRIEQFMNEIDILSRLHHPNLVSLYGCTSHHSHDLLLVYEFIPNGTVSDHLHGDPAKKGALTWPIRMSIAIETADALAYLHAVDIIHRDIKTNNILLDNHFHVKVADFGLSRLFPMDKTHVSTAPQGTIGYVDPDYHRCYQLNDRSDVYSFGVVLMELISSKPAVDLSRRRDEINLAKMAVDKIHNHALDEFVDPGLGFQSEHSVRRRITSVAELALQCLHDEKEMRPSMEEVLEMLRGIGSDQHKTERVEVDIPA